jgi:hypothetical protein
MYATPVVEKDDQFELVTAAARKKLAAAAQAYRWDRAFSWDQRIVVPSASGAAVINPENGEEIAVELVQNAALTKPSNRSTRVLLDRRGVIAWMPFTDGAARFIDGRWQKLGTKEGWPAKVIEILPLLDGTAVVLSAVDDPRQLTPPLTQLSSVVLDADEPVDAAALEKLVAQLSADESAKRDAASAELSRYGPRAWPILEKLLPDQPPEGRVRIEELLAMRISPALGVLRPVGFDLRVINYLRDGGVVLYTDAGVETPQRGHEETRVVAPAWLAVRPGRAVSVLAPALIQDATPDRMRFLVWGDEWIVTDDVSGPMRFLGNHLRPMLRADEKRFAHFAGIDSRGRWLFREAADGAGATLVIDRFLPDPTPRLPVWTIEVNGGDAGWSDKDWPVTRKVGAWALLEDRWEALPDDAKVTTERPDSTAPPEPTTTPATTQSSLPLGPPILIEKDGTRWYDGVNSLRRIAAAGNDSTWPLPAEALGVDGYMTTLIRAENRLFLFNSPGRVLRIRESPALAIEATFTRDIPNTDEPARIWLDPAGRIVIAFGSNKLALLFPSGRIPGEIAKMMPAGWDDE